MNGGPATAAPVFVDTSYLVALLNRRDLHHGEASELASRWARERTALATSDAVLLELGNFFARSPIRRNVVPAIRRIRSAEGWSVVGLGLSLLHRAELRYEGFADKSWSLTDCVSMEAMRDLGASDIATADAHFEQAGLRILLRR